MNIICVDTDRCRLMKLWRDVMKIAPNANTQTFSEMGGAVRYATGHGCDVLLAELASGYAAWNGVDLAEQIRNVNPRVKIIFFSPEPPEQAIGAIRGAEIDGYIQRPYDAARLAEALTRPASHRASAGQSIARGDDER